VRRVGAVDYGRKRIGLAVADPLGLSVRGLETLVRPAEMRAAAERVRERLLAEGVSHVVVGLPLHLGGEASEMSREAEAFARALAEGGALSVETFDEGLTSWEAEEALRRRGRPLREARRSGEVDREAAVALLRAWLLEEEGRAGRRGPGTQ
jgi:putative Holliday junction resolvase